MRKQTTVIVIGSLRVKVNSLVKRFLCILYILSVMQEITCACTKIFLSLSRQNERGWRDDRRSDSLKREDKSESERNDWRDCSDRREDDKNGGSGRRGDRGGHFNRRDFDRRDGRKRSYDSRENRGDHFDRKEGQDTRRSTDYRQSRRDDKRYYPEGVV